MGAGRQVPFTQEDRECRTLTNGSEQLLRLGGVMVGTVQEALVPPFGDPNPHHLVILLGAQRSQCWALGGIPSAGV